MTTILIIISALLMPMQDTGQHNHNSSQISTNISIRRMGETIQTQQFGDEASCQAAAEIIKNNTKETKTVCVPYSERFKR